MLEWRRRREPSTLMLLSSPLIAIGLTMLIGMIVFTAMGYDGFHAVESIFLTPFLEPQRWGDIGVKGAPLIMIALGLAIGFRANVWNIGAEGQYVMGAIAGTGVALLTYDMTGWWILPAMVLAGILGGMAWAAIPAFLRVKLQVSEILTSLMLTYVAVQFLYFLVRGPWKDPGGFNFPQTRMFTADQTLPTVLEGTLVHLGIPAALVLAVIAWLLMEKTTAGYAIKVVGLAPAAARHGGFSAARTTWATMLISGALAGLAGLFEAAGPFGQLTPQFPVGYGFTAIIVAFLGRLKPLGIVFGGIVLAGTYVGGEIAQSTVRLPQAATGLFQATLLFMLLATDVLVRWRIAFKRRPA
ncbi:MULTISPECIES: ABC transporter permease [Bosea]|uniref:ABC transporter permease n=1 Tax=Bosea TaxID=85413 RepID=UPI00214FB038|nr:MULTISPECIES: ABC transporter permease [Bosea]MCR4523644.1 ABC transporter permease [Bosea sp. 47.2.35]MDR6826947.1 simple sugar transport system permease protein [Bosea robiniae]MDR6893657.1 simple sugar transport system permease protein [Bosea sp. BE109]MDR7136643.1 simple sugar transport system permease protein [Bosea sp. BE168]MDR7173342.1 simple sugar transport system permease protein [Bosea sp. BE271]